MKTLLFSLVLVEIVGGSIVGRTERIKRFVYIRHAQSLYNARNSITDYFIRDPGLSEFGTREAQALAAWVESDFGGCGTNIEDGSPTHASCNPAVRELMKTSLGIAWLTSNLKRTLLTGIILHRSKVVSSDPVSPRFHILSSLQEVSILPDAQATTGTFQSPVVDLHSLQLYRDEHHEAHKRSISLSASGNDGNLNGINYVPVLDRLSSFCEWTKGRPESVFGVVGHAGWLNKFFAISRNMRRDHSDYNIIEELLSRGRAKLDNTAVVSFEIEYIDNDRIGCRLVSESTELVYGRLIEKKFFLPSFKNYFSKPRITDDIPLVSAHT